MSASAQARRSVINWPAFWSATFLLAICLSIAFIGLLIFLYFWLIGGRFTIDGTAQLANTLARFIGAPLHIGVPLVWQLYLYALPIPIAASAVEFGVPIVVALKSPPRRAVVALWVVWLLMSGLDLYTTFTGTGIATAQSHPLRQWLAVNAPARGVATGLLTFGPELLSSALLFVVGMAWRDWLATWRGDDTGSSETAR